MRCTYPELIIEHLFALRAKAAAIAVRPDRLKRNAIAKHAAIVFAFRLPSRFVGAFRRTIDATNSGSRL